MHAAQINPDEYYGLSHLHVAIFSDAIPERNGVGAYYYDLHNAILDHVADVQFFHPEYSSRSEKLSFPLPGDDTQRVNLPPSRQIRRVVETIRPDIFIIATPGPYGLLGMRIAKKSGARILAGFHTDFEKITQLYWNRFLGRLIKYYFVVVHRMIFRSADLVLGNSAEMLKTATELGAKQTELMGTSIPRIFIDKPVTPQQLPISQIIYAGRLAAEKNIDDIISAAESLPQIDFVLVGDGPLYNKVSQAGCRLDNLYCPGWLKRKELLAEIDASELLILPSSVESFGTIALEAMARARLVLASSACGIFDWPELKGQLFQIAVNETLTDAINRLCDMDTDLLKIKSRNAHRAAVKFNESSVHNWLSRILQQVDEPISEKPNLQHHKA